GRAPSRRARCDNGLGPHARGRRGDRELRCGNFPRRRRPTRRADDRGRRRALRFETRGAQPGEPVSGLCAGRCIVAEGPMKHFAGPSLRRRDLLRALGAAGLSAAGASPCGRRGGAPGEAQDPLDTLPAQGRRPDVLHIGVTPTAGERTTSFFEPIVRYLEHRRAMRAAIVVATSYSELAELVRAGSVDGAFFSPLAYVE